MITGMNVGGEGDEGDDVDEGDAGDEGDGTGEREHNQRG